MALARIRRTCTAGYQKVHIGANCDGTLAPVPGESQSKSTSYLNEKSPGIRMEQLMLQDANARSHRPQPMCCGLACPVVETDVCRRQLL